VRFACFELAQVRARADATGGKVNDVVLDLAGGLNELLLGRGEPVVDLKLIASAPVAFRTSVQDGTFRRRLLNALGEGRT
jgi:hypothetical protein